MKKPVLIGIVFVIAVIAVLVFSTMNIAKYRVEVCMTFNGQVQCRTASADTQEHALRAATANACATISSGVTDSMACEHGNPTSVKWLK